MSGDKSSSLKWHNVPMPSFLSIHDQPGGPFWSPCSVHQEVMALECNRCLATHNGPCLTVDIVQCPVEALRIKRGISMARTRICADQTVSSNLPPIFGRIQNSMLYSAVVFLRRSAETLRGRGPGRGCELGVERELGLGLVSAPPSAAAVYVGGWFLPALIVSCGCGWKAVMEIREFPDSRLMDWRRR